VEPLPDLIHRGVWEVLPVQVLLVVELVGELLE
jgi:hypothetical protein